MIRAKVRVENIQGLDAQFAEVEKAIETNIREVAFVARDEAKTTAAFRDKTGNLRRSIKARKKKNADATYVVSATGRNKDDMGYHAALVEYGHVKFLWGHPQVGERVAARPFMRPAAETAIKHAVELFRRNK